MSVVRASPGTARGARGAPLGYGVIGNTADSGSVVLGSSPGTPALFSAGFRVRIPRRLRSLPPFWRRAGPKTGPETRPRLCARGWCPDLHALETSHTGHHG